MAPIIKSTVPVDTIDRKTPITIPVPIDKHRTNRNNSGNWICDLAASIPKKSGGNFTSIGRELAGRKCRYRTSTLDEQQA